MPRKRGQDSVHRKGRSTGTQLERAPDATASSRDRPPQSKRQKQRDSEIAASTPYGDYRARRKTS